MKTNEQLVLWTQADLRHFAANAGRDTQYVVVELDPGEFAHWHRCGFVVAVCFSRQWLAWANSQACHTLKCLEQFLLNHYGKPTGPADTRPWNRYVSLAESVEWIVMRDPRVLTLALLSITPNDTTF